MYSNIGRKIMVLAEILVVIAMVLWIILGIIVIVRGCMANYDDEMIELILIGVATIVLGPLFSWISGFLLYGFGELIDSASIIAKKLAPEEFEDE